LLTCKLLVKPGYRGERPIELPSSWFPSKGPSGSLPCITVSRGKDNDWRHGGFISLTYSQTLNERIACLLCWTGGGMNKASGPPLVSSTGDEG
jgi:hypothetical protein